MVRHAEATEVAVPAGDVRLAGTLTVPERPIGVVLFAHGSGSSRHSPRNTYVSGVLNQAGLATLLIDLLTQRESDDRANVFDIDLLADRLSAAVSFTSADPGVVGLPIGLFGASTGAAAALVAAANGPSVRAVVSRGGRPDLAGDWLPKVKAPTLLVVGGDDVGVIELNQQALAALRCPKRLVLVPGATHLFEEPGTLEQVAAFARDWFVQHLSHHGNSP